MAVSEWEVENPPKKLKNLKTEQQKKMPLTLNHKRDSIAPCLSSRYDGMERQKFTELGFC